MAIKQRVTNNSRLKNKSQQKEDTKLWTSLRDHLKMTFIPLHNHTKKIMWLCALVVIPIIAFTIVILVLVFANTVENMACICADVCPPPSLLNTTNKSSYNVDFPATRLVFIAS
jgi:hypothetical protein